MYHSGMQRRKRHHLSDEVFTGQNHIVSLTICTADRGRWLARHDLAAIVQADILGLHEDHPVVGYCIMPDHLHLLMGNSGSTLGSIVRGIKGRTSRRIHRIEPGLSLWQADYWDHIVRRAEGLYSVLQYILMNPVRAGIVNNWWDYEWSGSPLAGRLGPEFFSSAAPEDILWRDLLNDGP